MPTSSSCQLRSSFRPELPMREMCGAVQVTKPPCLSSKFDGPIITPRQSRPLKAVGSFTRHMTKVQLTNSRFSSKVLPKSKLTKMEFSAFNLDASHEAPTVSD